MLKHTLLHFTRVWQMSIDRKGDISKCEMCAIPHLNKSLKSCLPFFLLLYHMGTEDIGLKLNLKGEGKKSDLTSVDDWIEKVTAKPTLKYYIFISCCILIWGVNNIVVFLPVFAGFLFP